jgi:phage portal protein BeeE
MLAAGGGVSETTVAGLSAVVRCVSIIANGVAGSLWRELDAAGAERPSSRLVRRPCEVYTRRDWTWRVVATMALHNRAHLWMVGGRDSEGIPWSILPLRPDQVSPVHRYQIAGWFLPPESYYVGGAPVPTDAIVTVDSAPWPSIDPELSGVLRLARQTFAMMLSADVYAARYWAAGGAPVTIIKTEQHLSPDQAAELGQRWQDRRAQGPDYPAVLGMGADAKAWGADPTTQTAVDARRDMVAEVARYFGIPVSMVNAPSTGDSGQYRNVQADGITLVRHTLQAYADPLESAWADILPGGRTVDIDVERFARPIPGAEPAGAGGRPPNTPPEDQAGQDDGQDDAGDDQDPADGTEGADDGANG